MKQLTEEVQELACKAAASTGNARGVDSRDALAIVGAYQAALDAAQQAQPVNAMLLEALEAAEKLEHTALVALSEATDELKVGNTYTTATDTYKAHNDLIHRLDKILNLQYRDRKREARLAAQQAQPVCGYDDTTGNCTRVNCCKQAQPARCPCCDDTGDVHTPTGEWRGKCNCKQAQPEPRVPKGFALVPLRPTRAMEDVFQQDDWQWADVLAAAESVTEEQYLFALEDDQQAQPERECGKEVPVALDHCPITGMKFWGNISHPELGYIATYGGPFDTYTIPSIGDDGELRSERYDQDAGEWTEGGEPIGWFSKEQFEQAQPEPSEFATIAGLEATVSHLSLLVDEQLRLLIDVNKECGTDGHGGEFEDGESIIIDRVRAHIASMETPSVVDKPFDQIRDEAAVDAFAAVMKRKLSKAREKGRGGWQECSQAELSALLHEHVEKGDPRDVANFCMFLHYLGFGIAAQQAQPELGIRNAIEKMLSVLENGEGHKLGCKTHAFSDKCTCGYEESVGEAIKAGRAALDAPKQAQPEELQRALMDVTIEEDAAKMLRDYLVQEDDDEPNPIRLLLGDGHSGHGLYLAAAEYPEEGAILLAKVEQQGQSEPTLQWCDKCGEGTVQGLCRGNLDDCKFKAKPAREGLTPAQRYSWLRLGKPYSVIVKAPTKKNPDATVTIMVSPNPETDYGRALDAAIDTAIKQRG